LSLLEQFIALNVFAFIMTFVRIGTAVMIMPGVGDSFVPANVRLYFALALSVVLMPLVAVKLPSPVPTGALFFILIFIEFMIGALIGTVARILMAATDIAGMIISFQAGLSNAQLFNPQMAGQGSLIGAFLSVTGATLLFVLDLHHLMIMGLMESYTRFPVGDIPDVGSMAQVVTNMIATSFLIACQMSAPFLILILILYTGMGVLSKLMPQLQIFILAMPVQIILSLIIMTLTVSAMMMYFTTAYRDALGAFLGG
jgi:flagellar biosynthetic protein FliR